MKKLFFTLILTFAANSIFAANEVRLMPKERWTMSEDGQFAYATRITTDSITLQVELFSPQMKMRSQMSGLVAYIDLTGKKKEKYSVAFPVVKGFIEHAMGEQREMGERPQKAMGRMPREALGEWQHEGSGEMKQGQRGPVVDFDTIQIPPTVKPVLVGDSYASLFVDKDEQMLSPDDVTLSYTNGRMFYSLSLPLSRFGNKRNKKNVFSIAIALRDAAMQMPKMGEGMTPPGGGMGGPGGGMGGPGRGMGGHGGGMGGPGGGMGGHGGGMGALRERNSASHSQNNKQWLEVRQD